ncbi:MAG: glycerophosphodiester phosphodiesterase family protein [Microvirga sp.]
MSDLSWLIAKPIAHRGLHDRGAGVIENTITAAQAAVDRGFSIECDVQLTADGEAVVFHDFDLNRLTAEQGKVGDRRLAELTAIAIAGSASDRIPSLQGFLDRVAGRVPLVIEIKSRFDGDMRLTDRVCDVLAGYRGPFALKSFDPDIVARVRTIAPHVARGIIAQLAYTSASDDFLSPQRKHALANLLHFPDSQPQFLSWHVKDLPSAVPNLFRHLGHLPVMTWTVRTPEDRLKAQAYADQMVFEGFLP